VIKKRGKKGGDLDLTDHWMSEKKKKTGRRGSGSTGGRSELRLQLRISWEGKKNSLRKKPEGGKTENNGNRGGGSAARLTLHVKYKWPPAAASGGRWYGRAKRDGSKPGVKKVRE